MNNRQARFVALIRGINVCGSSVIKMSELKKIFESLNFTNVTTYIQSGNVIFSTLCSDPEQLSKRIEKKLVSVTGNKSRVFVLTHQDLKQAAMNNPFNPTQKDEQQYCYLMFLSAQPDDARVKALLTLKGQEYQFHVSGKILYYAYPRAYAGRRRMVDFEKVLGVTGTSRSWKVVARLIELLAEND